MGRSPVAYLSPEFGVDPRLPQYSGGLGVLAGDHLKAASDAAIPMVGVGLFYHHGYFTQSLGADGGQVVGFADLEPSELGLSALQLPDLSVDVETSTVRLRCWQVDIGSVKLLLLDSDMADNGPENRKITDRLYGGDQRHRLHQEVVLGIGGIRALDAAGIQPSLFHLNEGHAGFSALERIRRTMLDQGASLPEAIQAVRSAALFTTHTPVPAGIDRFSRALMADQFTGWCQELGVSLDDLMSIGAEPGVPAGESFNMACMSLRLSGATNGVSRLHGEVSRRMFSALWPQLDESDAPIGHVTNGVHVPSWVAPEMAELLSDAIGANWPTASPQEWERARAIPDSDLWYVRCRLRERLVENARHHATQPDVVGLDPAFLTIGFARRFATYKRADLLLADAEALARLLGEPTRPVQILVAGKAHPADAEGQSMLARVVRSAVDPQVRGRLVFLEDYDMALAAQMVQGADLWLNNPRRPMEACGTSGMKSLYNGGLNCSILDGWWDESYEPGLGWALPSFEDLPDQERDHAEAEAALSILTTEVMGLFYERDDSDRPARWLEMVRSALVRLGPEVSASRMIHEYDRRYYS